MHKIQKELKSYVDELFSNDPYDTADLDVQGIIIMSYYVLIQIFKRNLNML